MSMAGDLPQLDPLSAAHIIQIEPNPLGELILRKYGETLRKVKNGAEIPYGVVGEHTRLSRGRPGFNSRWGSFLFTFVLWSTCFSKLTI